MTDATAEASETPAKKKGMLLPILLVAVLGGGGFASTFLGVWSPSALLAPGEYKPATRAETAPQVDFIDVPRIRLSIASDQPRTLLLDAKIETGTADRAQVEHLMPRVSDAFNSFLADIDPKAFGKRGVLEIVRAELVTRARYVLGDEVVKDLLITEFMLQ
ncbi:MAG: flagellar basal body-associated FliL family protein [Paracoccus sp. (in: a-proteobacteria)]|uniref:flagellar basal body-associated FliL family protein n=1 Tax=Paracoccus sp. TaxID=267 RepID=UPI0026DF3FF4|nr:flagellar basal body-associated FliL family protein [Paracoccus sp. (in: a-proteobacteria)]MDO5620007.1 flagellar basal body-associated FliL family protein [Paracoccus sp. (in: a-proteobacteria)]